MGKFYSNLTQLPPIIWNISLFLGGNSKAFASEFLENIEDMFPSYNMNSDSCKKFMFPVHKGLYALSYNHFLLLIDTLIMFNLIIFCYES